MLKQLSVQNYALIDHLEIDFSDGLTIITGETGAGKSVLLGALSLLLGQRADIQALNDKSKKCITEGIFSIKNYSLKDFFYTNELDYEAETTIRREISAEGKSRAFINDTPVNLNVLKELGEKLIDIHSQHETLTLNDSEFQLSVVDAYAQNAKLLGEYQSDYKKYKQIENTLNELIHKETQSKKDLDYYQFQFNELEEANLSSDDQIKLEQELETLTNAEEIKSNLSKAYNAFDGGENNILVSINAVKSIISSIAKYNPAIDEINNRLNSSYIEIKDIAVELENIENEITHDANRIEELNARLDNIYRLQHKHQVKTIDELLKIKDDLSNKLNDISSLEEQITLLNAELTKLKKELLQKAGQLSKNREGVIPKIEKEIKNLLSSLGMPNARLQIINEKTDNNNFNSTGVDKINFLFSANKGSELKKLNKVASGGELSRLMLSLKSLIAKLTALPSVIFDEIDTGVSGDIADKVGSIMQKMSDSMQVITITHLPQIASKGTTHLFVYKEEKNNKTFTRIKKLNKEERVQEIAKMLSTDNPTSAAIKNAKELLSM